MTSVTRPVVFMDVNIGETPAGRLKMELFSDIVPKCVFCRLSSIIALNMPPEQLRTSGNSVLVNTGRLSFASSLAETQLATDLTLGRKGTKGRPSIGAFDHRYPFDTISC